MPLGIARKLQFGLRLLQLQPCPLEIIAIIQCYLPVTQTTDASERLAC